MRDQAELAALLRELSTKPADVQRAAMAELSETDLEDGDLIMSGLRMAAGHAERPSGSGTWCNWCGVLRASNARVLWAFHPAEFQD